MCMYTYICIYIYTDMYTPMHACIHTSLTAPPSRARRVSEQLNN